MKASRSADQLTVRRVMAAADSPAEVPKNSARAGTKSFVDSPCRYSRGRTSATFGERREYGGRIELRNRERSPVDPAVVHPGRGHLDGPGPGDHGPPPGRAVADHQSTAPAISSLPVSFQIGVHLRLQGHGAHLLGHSAADLIQGEDELLAGPLISEYPEHRRTSFRRRINAGNSDQWSTGGYATPITRSRIHNFRSYLPYQGMAAPP